MSQNGFRPRVHSAFMSVYRVEHVVGTLETVYGAKDVSMREEVGHFRAASTYVGLEHLDASYNALSLHVAATYPASGMIRQQFVLTGSTRVAHGNKEFVGAAGATLILPGDADLRREVDSDFSQIMLRIDENRLRSKLGALIGGPVNRPLQFDCGTGAPTPAKRRLHRLTELLVREATEISSAMPALQAAEFEQMLMLAFLVANRNNYSHLLENDAPQAAPWQVRRIEDYIEVNWDRPLSIERLAQETGVPVRSIFWSFKKARNYSPMGYLQQVRLRHARQMLQLPEQSTTVTAVALRCGFQNLGNFSRYYREIYGELPSATLAAAKGTPSLQLPSVTVPDGGGAAG
jgi:AraC-like DNA-binding protein